MVAKFRRRLQASAFIATAALFAGPTFPHDGAGRTDGFAPGFLHPLLGVDHLLAMVAVGLWGAFLGRPLVFLLPMIFPAVMAFGGVLGMAAVSAPPVEIGIAVSVLALGAAIAAAYKAPLWAASAIVAFFALFHGYAHGQELPEAADPIGYSVGFVLATGLLHVAGIALGLLNRRSWGEAVTRGVGALIAAAGVWFVLAALRA